ncbi:MAG: DUF169 domain-containing protein [candidate division Zixibacteria bacterium]|nr:DUF169 domain-containing protein [candidate division Zixibacteria bacterium]
MEWKEYSEELKGLLKLKGSPIAVTYSMNPPKNYKKGKCRACDALVLARDGQTVNLTKESSSCRGGIWSLGLAPQPSGDAFKALQKFLVEGEKLCASIVVFHRMRALNTPAPLGLADNVIVSPLEKSETRPELVVFICNPEQASRLITLATYYDGIPPKLEITGSTCRMSIAYPIVSGQMNANFFDYTSRKIKGFGQDELIISIPYEKMDNLIKAIPNCTAGTAKIEYPEEFRRLAGE